MTSICRSLRLRRVVPLVLAAALLFQAVSCGTILYPERRGQPAGRLDWGVVALDGIGLLLFFVPGVIAFAVDFATGAIYLPPHGYGQAQPPDFDPQTWSRVDVDPRELDRQRIETVVGAHAGQPVHLEPGTYRVRELHESADPPIQQTAAREPAGSIRSAAR